MQAPWLSPSLGHFWVAVGNFWVPFGGLGPSGDVVTAARPITTWPHARGEPKSNSIGARFGSFVAVVAFFGARLGCYG